MPELLVTLEAMAKVEKRKNKFMAALQGVDIDKDQEDGQGENTGPATFEEVQARAVARLTGDKNLAGAHAAGITPDMGIEYKISEGTGIG
jgi:hypothetical protein